MSGESDGAQTRRKPRLADERENEEKLWQVRAPDGRVWGSVGMVKLKELLEVGVLSTDAEVAVIGSEDWTPLGNHKVWAELRAPARIWKFDSKKVAELEPKATQIEFGGEGTPPIIKQQENGWVREYRQVRRRMFLWRLAQGLRALRELFVFVAFLAFGDLLTAEIDPALGLVKWVVSMGVLVLAVGYYSLRMLGR